MKRYEVIPSAGRFQLCVIEEEMRTRLWPRYDSRGEAEAEQRARERRDGAVSERIRERVR